MKKYILFLMLILSIQIIKSQTFNVISPNETFNYNSSLGGYFVTPQVIYDRGMVDFDDVIIKTLNAGSNWSVFLRGWYSSMVFYGVDTIFSLNYIKPDFFFYKTLNGFKTYDSVEYKIIYEISKGNDNIYLRGSKYSKDTIFIYRSEDFGKSWKIITDKPLQNIVFVNDSVGYARYGDPITTMWVHAKTTDNGLTWEKIPNSIYGREYFEGVAYELYPDGYYLGEGFQKSIDEGRTWIPINNGIPDDAQFGISTTDPFRLWKFISPTTGFFYEHQYGLFKTIDGGQNWVPIWNDYKLHTNDMHIIYENKKVYILMSTMNSAAHSMYYGVFDSLDIWNSIDTEAPLKNKIRVFPNPAKEEVNIQTSGFFNMNTSIRVYDAAGKQVLETKLQIPQTTIDISGLDKGIYFLKILNGDGEFVEKLIKD
jgi:hypothetical protein